MKDLENINNRPDREDSTGDRQHEPAYKSFTKDKRPRTATTDNERREYNNRDGNFNRFNGNREAGNGESSGYEKRYDSTRTENNGNREGGYNRSYGSREGGYKKYDNGERRSNSYGNREGGYGNRSYGNRDGVNGENQNRERRYDSPRTENGGNREGGNNRSYGSSEGGYKRSYNSSYNNGEKRSYGSREGGYNRDGNKDGYKRSEGGGYNPNSDQKGSYNRSENGYKRTEGGYKRSEGNEYNRSGNNYEGSERRSFNPNFDSANRPVNRNNYGGERNYNKSEGGYSRPYNKDYNRSGDSERSNSYGERKPRTFGDASGTGEKRTWQERGESGKPYNRDGGYGSRQDKPYGKPSSSFEKRGDRPSGGKWQSGDRQHGGQGKTQYNKPRYNQENYPTFPAPVIEDKIRLNRYISMSGICSRREADEFIQQGMVTVNGLTVTELGAKVAQTDEIRFNDNIIKNEKKVYIVMNKPKGYVTSIEDPHADKTVMDLLKNGCRERVYPVGRLDKNSLGVLLITNDGDLAKKLTHPSFEKKKVYQVSLDKPLTHADMDLLVSGFELEDGEIHADSASYVGEKKNEVGVEIHSGRNRIVRRMFEHLGYRVTKLDRVYFAGMTKQKLKRGEWRFLSPREVQALQSGQYE